MRALRFQRFWLAGSGGVVGLMLFVLLSPAGRVDNALGLNDKLLHGIAFFMMASWFFGIVSRRRWVSLLFGMVVFAGLTEILQFYGSAGRVGDWRDFLADLVGLLLAWALAAIGLDRWCEQFERWLPA